MNPNETYGLIITTEYRGIPIVFASGEVNIGLKDVIRRSAVAVIAASRKLIDEKLG